MSLETSTQHAHAVLRAAHDASYRYPPDFGGFSAEVDLTDGQQRGHGRIVASSPRAVEVCLPGVSTDLAEWVKQTLASELMHRWPRPYEAGDGRYQLVLEQAPEHPLGDCIRLLDDPFHSSYRVRDGVITLVAREIGDEAFHIITLVREPGPDGRWLPTHYVVVFHDRATGQIRRTSVHEAQYTVVDGVALPERMREVTTSPTGLVVREMRLHNHQRLPRSQGVPAA